MAAGPERRSCAVEPIPDRDAFAGTAEGAAFYERMMRCPWFLFIRALARGTADCAVSFLHE